jgi:antitoxin VapB
MEYLIALYCESSEVAMSEIVKAKLFMNGRGQAVRLPRQFRMPGTEVRIRREGKRIILEPISSPMTLAEIDAMFAGIDAILGDEPFPDCDDTVTKAEPEKLFE